MPSIEINWEKAEHVFGTLLAALREEIHPYDVAKPPQRKENLPKDLVWGSVEHARFLFCCCYYMRGGIESDTAIIALSRLYERAPQLFDPFYFTRFDRIWIRVVGMEIQSLLQLERLNFNSVQIGHHWVLNFRKLARFWEGDPAKLFQGAQSYRELCTRVMRGKKKGPNNPHGFFGFREKMVSMLAHFLRDAEIVPEFMFPVPVDFHVLRIMVSQELLVVPKKGIGDDVYSPDLLAAARTLSMGYCAKHGVDPLRLGDALWLLSRTLCRHHPGNAMNVGKPNGRWTVLSEVPVIWSDSQVLQYNRSCAVCPISGCVYNIPSAHYYIGGKLVLKGKRTFPLQLFSREA